MNYTSIHINYEENVNLEVSEEHENAGAYRVIKIGDYTTIYATTEQVEALFDELDKKLHKETYSDMQDRCINLEIDLDNANEIIEGLEENLSEVM